MVNDPVPVPFSAVAANVKVPVSVPPLSVMVKGADKLPLEAEIVLLNAPVPV